MKNSVSLESKKWSRNTVKTTVLHIYKKYLKSAHEKFTIKRVLKDTYRGAILNVSIAPLAVSIFNNPEDIEPKGNFFKRKYANSNPYRRGLFFKTLA
jgi:hypothetical protein